MRARDLIRRTKAFYDREFARNRYATASVSENHPSGWSLRTFVTRHSLGDRRCLEIGCGRGAFQDLVEDYVGVDISESVGRYFRKPFFVASATNLPFADSMFDAVWTIHALEHIHEPGKVLKEIRRLLKPNGLLFLAPAWQCRSWARNGYPIRPYSDFGIKGKIIKASVPVRNSLMFRSLYVFPRRFIRFCTWLARRRPTTFKCRKITPDYEHFRMVDSDAVNSMDPYEAILWFVSRGDECVSYRRRLSQLFVRTGPIVFRLREHEEQSGA